MAARNGPALDRALWKEEYALNLVFQIVKSICGADSIDAKKVQGIETQDRFFAVFFDAMTANGVSQVWRKFCDGELLAQKKYPELKLYAPKHHDSAFERICI